MAEDERLRRYLEAVDRLPPLTPAELADLAERLGPGTDPAAPGRDAARKRLIEGSLRTVVEVASRHRDRGRPLRALLEAGNLALVRSVDTFDWRHGPGFPDHARTQVRSAIDAAAGRDEEAGGDGR